MGSGRGGVVVVPMVPRPPIFILPKRRKGAEQVTMLGVTWRMTITLEGSWGMSFSLMVTVVEKGLGWKVFEIGGVGELTVEN